MAKSGFTLIEIMTVVAIIGILAGLTVYTWGSISMHSRNSARKVDIERIRGVLQQYYTDKRSYPRAVGESYVAHCAFGDQLRNYLNPIPKDPRNDTELCQAGEIERRFHYFYLYFPQGAGEGENLTFPENFTLAMTIEGEREFVGRIENIHFSEDQTVEPNRSYNFTDIVTGRGGR